MSATCRKERDQEKMLIESFHFVVASVVAHSLLTVLGQHSECLVVNTSSSDSQVLLWWVQAIKCPLGCILQRHCDNGCRNDSPPPRCIRQWHLWWVQGINCSRVYSLATLRWWVYLSVTLVMGAGNQLLLGVFVSDIVMMEWHPPPPPPPPPGVFVSDTVAMGAGNQLLPGVFFGDIAMMGVFVIDTCDGCRNQLLDVFFSDFVMMGAGTTPPPPPPPRRCFHQWHCCDGCKNQLLPGVFFGDIAVMGARNQLPPKGVFISDTVMMGARNQLPPRVYSLAILWWWVQEIDYPPRVYLSVTLWWWVLEINFPPGVFISDTVMMGARNQLPPRVYSLAILWWWVQGIDYPPPVYLSVTLWWWVPEINCPFGCILWQYCDDGYKNWLPPTGVFVSDTCDGCRELTAPGCILRRHCDDGCKNSTAPSRALGCFVSDTVVMGARINCSRVYASVTIWTDDHSQPT